MKRWVHPWCNDSRKKRYGVLQPNHLPSRYLLCAASDPLGFACLWDRWPSRSVPALVMDDQLCAGSPAGNTAPCICPHQIPLMSWAADSLLVLRYETPLDSLWCPCRVNRNVRGRQHPVLDSLSKRRQGPVDK